MCIREGCTNKRRGLSGRYQWYNPKINRMVKAKYTQKPQPFSIWCTFHINERK